MKKLVLLFMYVCVFGVLNLYATITKVEINTAGTLQEILGSNLETIDSIKISGELNNSDMLVLKKMTVSYKLAYIDLYDASAYIGSNAFEGSSGIKHIILPQNCTSIGYLAFAHCSNLETIILGKKVRSLDNGCLRGCGKLKSITLPKTVTSIGTQCFDSYTRFNDIYCEGSTPPSASTNAWSYFGTTVHVPIGSKKNYQFANGWMNFENIVEYQVDNTHTLSYELTGEGRIYLNGQLLTTSPVVIDNEEPSLLRFEATEGWEIETVYINNKDVLSEINNNQILLYPTENNISLKVSFKKKPVSISIQSCEQGKLTQSVEYGKIISFKIEPSENWKINTVTYNGKDVTSELTIENEFTTPAVTEDAIFTVSFESTISSVSSANLSKAKIYAYGGQIIVNGVENGTAISVYNEGGELVSRLISKGYEDRINIQSNGIYFVKAGEKTVKVLL